MHFIGMLAVGAPIPIGYDALTTIISAFIGILLTGLGLYAASSGHITRGAVLAGGALMGGGIAGMHYMGMSALRASCTISYQPSGVIFSILVGITASTLALWFIFRERSPFETSVGAVVLGLAISAMHYSAMFATNLVRTDEVLIMGGSVLSQHGLAFVVAIAAFFICGLFLTIALPDKKYGYENLPAAASPFVETTPSEKPFEEPGETVGPQKPVRIPVRRNESIFFAAPDSVLAVRADGRYTWIALRSQNGEIDELFCEKSISALAKELSCAQFVRSHRSHIVNVAHVTGYRRHGDGALLLLDPEGKASVPVSRSHLHKVLTELEGKIGLEAPAPTSAATP
jgi:NO-binding membrane sensor protein with MHYT domain